MPIQTVWNEFGIHWICSGVVSREQLMGTIIEGFYNDERSNVVSYEIFDCSSATELQISKQDAIFFAGTDVGRSKALPVMKLAFVASEPQILELIHTYINAFNRINHSWKFHIFENSNDAVNWVETGGMPVIRKDISGT